MAIKPFYGSRKESDTKKFNAAMEGLTSLYSPVKGGKKKLAAELNVSTSTLNRWIKGKGKPKDIEKLNTITKKYSSLKNTIKDESKAEKFRDKKKKEIAADKLIKPVTIIVEDLNKWLDRNFQKRYGQILKWDYFRNMVNTKGFNYVKYLSDNPREGLFLRTPDEYIMGNTFLQFVGVTMTYPFTDKDRQIFLRRMVRLVSGLRDNPTGTDSEAIEVMRKNTDRARELFYSGDNVRNKIEDFIGYYFD